MRKQRPEVGVASPRRTRLSITLGAVAPYRPSPAAHSPGAAHYYPLSLSGLVVHVPDSHSPLAGSSPPVPWWWLTRTDRHQKPVASADPDLSHHHALPFLHVAAIESTSSSNPLRASEEAVRPGIDGCQPTRRARRFSHRVLAAGPTNRQSWSSPCSPFNQPPWTEFRYALGHDQRGLCRRARFRSGLTPDAARMWSTGAQMMSVAP